MKRRRRVPATLHRRPTPVAQLATVRGGGGWNSVEIDWVTGDSVESQSGHDQGWDNVKNTTFSG